MSFTHTHYIPCLRWKTGEYQAVWQLLDTTKRMFTPLIEIPGLGWDFEEQKEKKTIDALLSDFAVKKIYKKWGSSPCFVDLNLIPPAERMENGVHPIRFIFNELRAIECIGVPVTGLLRDEEYQREIKAASVKDKKGICLRITIEEAAKSSFKEELGGLLSKLGVTTSDCDLVLDLGAPSFVPPEGFSMAIQAIVSKLPYLNDWRTFTLLGSSFPETMAGIKKGGEVVPRYEWKLYKMLVTDFKKAGFRLPTFGDYAINHPKEVELDWRVVKPPATIRYTIDDGWYIVKGDNVRDYGYEQFHELSKKVVGSRYYRDSIVSWGKEYIENCANRIAKRGNLTKWVQVGTNHHITKVTRDIASFYAS